MTLAEYIAQDGHTASDLAAKMKVAVSSITRAAKGDMKPSADMMAAIFLHTNGAVTPNDFFGIAA